MLIDQRCRLIIVISKCVSTHVVCGCRPMLPSALAYTRTHTLSRSLSLRVSVFISFHIKTHLPQISVIIEIQDSIVFGCSHFIKVALIRNDVRAKNTFTNNCTEKKSYRVELIWHLGFYLTFQEKYSDCQCDKLNFKMKS